MSQEPLFDIIVDDAVQAHVAAIERKDHSLILDAIEQQLSYEPNHTTRNGRPVAMLIAIEEEDDLDSLLLVHNPRFLPLLEEARQRARVTGGIPLAEFRRRLDVTQSE
jgi:antitoxin (DNA-binding transcriptional repressor) of toxin-antitoxin stability system